MLLRKLKTFEAEGAAFHNRPDFAAENDQNCVFQEIEDRLKQKVQPLAADLSLPPGLAKKMKQGQQGGGYGGSKEASGYTKVLLCQQRLM